MPVYHLFNPRAGFHILFSYVQQTVILKNLFKIVIVKFFVFFFFLYISASFTYLFMSLFIIYKHMLLHDFFSCNRFTEWIRAIGRPDLLSYLGKKEATNLLVCSKHFPRNMWINPNTRIKRLHKNAVPEKSYGKF